MPHRTWEEIQTTMVARRSHDAPHIRRMITTRDHNNGDLVITLPEVRGQPEVRLLIPQLVHEVIEGTAMRAAGQHPTIHVPAIDPAKEDGVRSREYAAIRRRALYARWFENNLTIMFGRAFRHLAGYGTMAAVAMNNPDGSAKIELRDPLSTYPELRAPEDMRAPDNVGFVYGRSPDWIARRFPEARDVFENYRPTGQHREETLWDIVEWIDESDIVMGLLGPRSLYMATPQTITNDQFAGALGPGGMELRRWPNLAGICTAVVPRRVTLDRIQGQMEATIPMVEWMARMMALESVEIEKHISPDMVVIGEDGRVPSIIGGEWKDGRTGEANLLTGVQAVQLLQGSPGPLTNAALDRMERAIRVSSGGSPFFGGETTGSLRTGRAIDALGGFSVDPRIQELQEIMAASLRELNKAIIAIELGYAPEKTFTVFSGWPSDRGHVTYKPSQHFESPANAVAYNFPGSDLSAVTVGVSQLVSSKLMSRHTGRGKHPYIEDEEQEERWIIEESIDDAILLKFQQDAVQGGIPLEVLAEVQQRVQEGVPHARAIVEVIAEERERQAQQVSMLESGQTQAPEVQAGLGPGPRPEDLAQIPRPQPAQRNLAELVRALAAPARAARAGQAGR
jgi:nucleotide-binding universal stress UspA family protein